MAGLANAERECGAVQRSVIFLGCKGVNYMPSLDVTKRLLHGYEYSPLEQCEKEVALKQMARDFPDVNPVWREWCYDFVTKEVGNEEMARRIQCGYYEKKVGV